MSQIADLNDRRADPSSLRWRVGDAFQQKVGGYVHAYRLTAVAPYVTLKGHPSLVLYWAGACAVCGGALVATTGRRPKSLVRTCLAHRGQWDGRRPGWKSGAHADG